MSTQKPTICLACHGLAYYGIAALSPKVLDTLEKHTGAMIGDIVEIKDEALVQGYVSPNLLAYSFLFLVFPRGEREEVEQDCLNYVRRTLGKTVRGTVWIEEQGQRIANISCRQGGWIPDPPQPKSDGAHFTVELKGANAQWELMEKGWESPNLFNDQGEAEVVAHNLAIRHEGDMDTRVVSPNGVVLVEFRFHKYLTTLPRGAQEHRKELSPRDELPMLHVVREAYLARRTNMS